MPIELTDVPEADNSTVALIDILKNEAAGFARVQAIEVISTPLQQKRTTTSTTN